MPDPHGTQSASADDSAADSPDLPPTHSHAEMGTTLLAGLDAKGNQVSADEAELHLARWYHTICSQMACAKSAAAAIQQSLLDAHAYVAQIIEGGDGTLAVVQRLRHHDCPDVNDIAMHKVEHTSLAGILKAANARPEDIDRDIEPPPVPAYSPPSRGPHETERRKTARAHTDATLAVGYHGASAAVLAQRDVAASNIANTQAPSRAAPPMAKVFLDRANFRMAGLPTAAPAPPPSPGTSTAVPPSPFAGPAPESPVVRALKTMPPQLKSKLAGLGNNAVCVICNTDHQQKDGYGPCPQQSYSALSAEQRNAAQQYLHYMRRGTQSPSSPSAPRTAPASGAQRARNGGPPAQRRHQQ